MAALADPFVLTTPLPDDLVVQPQWINTGNSHANNRFREKSWSLGPLTDQPGTIVNRIHWKNCPAHLRDDLKVLAWTLINGERRPTIAFPRRSTTRHSVSSLHKRLVEWLRWARWLGRHGVTRLSDCTDDHWRAYAGKLAASAVTRGTMEQNLNHLSDLWEFDQLTAAPTGVSRPPWDLEGVDDYLPEEKRASSRENSTEPLDPAVVGPLLVWSIRMIEDLADDVLAARDERSRIAAHGKTTTSTPEGRAALHAYVEDLLDAGSPLPVSTHRGRTRLAHLYIAARTGASLQQVKWITNTRDLGTLAMDRPGPAPMASPVRGLIDGRPWRENIDYGEVPSLWRHLGTAAAIIILYLTGMRPQEVQGLRSGCCPDPEPAAEGATRHLIHSVAGDSDDGEDDEAEPHLIHGRHYKNVRDDASHHVSAGEERSVPWVAIPPVVNAVRVLERMVPEGELLLSSVHHELDDRPQQGSLTLVTIADRIAEFVAWINQEAVRQRLPEQTVPEDPLGPINTARWRRTLAWHIARRPGGLVALAVQYGHMRTFLDARTSHGYGARGRRGMHGVLDMETVLATADTAARLRDATAAGKMISGPAARRALIDAADMPQFEGALTTARATRQLRQLDGHLLFDNPDGFLICAFKNENALCEPGAGAIAPLPLACQKGCGNAIRTDEHARAARKRADHLDLQAAHVPGPMARALHVEAAEWRHVANTHDTTARAAQEILT
nr:integrase [Streptomyces sp. SID4923]